MVNWNLPALEWWMFALPAVFLVGVFVATAVTFLRWRMGKKVVPRKLWSRMVDGYVALERAHRQLETSTADSQMAYEALLDRLDISNQENSALYQRLQALESHLDTVTAEATTLVTGLKDNEQRWLEAETVRSDLQAALVETRTQMDLDAQRAIGLEQENAELHERLHLATFELAEAATAIEELEAQVARDSTLQARLHEALDRDRQQTATLTRLEGRYRTTHQQLTEARRRADELANKIQSGTTGATRGVFDRPVPGNEPITLGTYDDLSIDLRGPESSPSAPEVSDEPVSRGSDRFARSYGRLPD